ncbi:hypothetical protein F0562_006038 [Nyssa sinensis]|uniref:Uncharacterized protein n=1 Tax=Nyssa sinensis TaxID=561372 RepID=A0A5J5AM92_9ASTE|nr:hypothetical protein F0562_006038 [Nyssa sinensis]
MQGDALATNSAHRPAVQSSASAAGVHSVEGSFGAGVPITLPASAPASFTQDTEQPINYDIQLLKTMEIGASSTATLLDNSVSTSANASQPENSTKITE